MGKNQYAISTNVSWCNETSFKFRFLMEAIMNNNYRIFGCMQIILLAWRESRKFHYSSGKLDKHDVVKKWYDDILYKNK